MDGDIPYRDTPGTFLFIVLMPNKYLLFQIIIVHSVVFFMELFSGMCRFLLFLECIVVF